MNIPLESEWTLPSGSHVQISAVVPDADGIRHVAEAKYIWCAWKIPRIQDAIVNLRADWLVQYGEQMRPVDRRNARAIRAQLAAVEAAARARGMGR